MSLKEKMQAARLKRELESLESAPRPPATRQEIMSYLDHLTKGHWNRETVAYIEELEKQVADYEEYQGAWRSLRPALADVEAFHAIMDVPVADTPEWPEQERIQLRFNLIREEYWELTQALGVRTDEKTVGVEGERDFVETADALADLVYVLLGTMLELGIGAEVWDEVQRSNMNKRDPETGKVERRPDGKVLKRVGWMPPDIEGVLREAGWRGDGNDPKIVDLRGETILGVPASGTPDDFKLIKPGMMKTILNDGDCVLVEQNDELWMSRVLSLRYWEEEDTVVIRVRRLPDDAWALSPNHDAPYLRKTLPKLPARRSPPC